MIHSRVSLYELTKRISEQSGVAAYKLGETLFDNSYCFIPDARKMIRGEEKDYDSLLEILDMEHGEHSWKLQALKERIKQVSDLVPPPKRPELCTSLLSLCSVLYFSEQELELLHHTRHNDYHTFMITLFLHAIRYTKTNSPAYIQKMMYEEALALHTDNPQRVTLFKRAAEYEAGRSKAACIELGNIYSSGSKTVSVNFKRALKYYKLAPRSPVALWSIGRMYEMGQGVPQSYITALEYYRKARKYGYPKAINSEGKFLARGYTENGQPDEEAAMVLFQQAADRGNVSALVNMGFLLERQAGRLETYESRHGDMQRALHCYTTAAEHGDAWAQNKVGELYFYEPYPWLCARDMDKAEHYFRASSKSQYARGSYNLGKLLKTKRGASGQSVKEAIACFRLALERGMAEAAYELALIYVEPPYHDYENPPSVCYELAKIVLDKHTEQMCPEIRSAAIRLTDALRGGAYYGHN